MPWTRKREYSLSLDQLNSDHLPRRRVRGLSSTDRESPLKPEELGILRGQYEREGEYAGIQTKFNYAWVCLDLLFKSRAIS